MADPEASDYDGDPTMRLEWFGVHVEVSYVGDSFHVDITDVVLIVDGQEPVEVGLAPFSHFQLRDWADDIQRELFVQEEIAAEYVA